MMTINAPIFDLDGSEIIEATPAPGLSALRRRVSRVATLDGGAAINDFGYSDADRTLNIEWQATREQADNIARMVKAYGRLIVSFRDGCFLGAPENFSPSEKTVSLSILIERRLDQ